MIRLILLTDFTEAFAYNLLRGILEYSKGREPWVVCRMPPSYRQQHGVEGVLKWACEWRADAIIGQFDDDDSVELFREHGIVVLAQDFRSRFTTIPNITSEYRITGQMVADFFLQKGFRHFAFYGYKDVVWSTERCQGFRERVAAQGLGDDFREYQHPELENLWFYEPTPLADWLKSLPHRTALMACDDNQGNRITEICRVSGIKIPDDIAVMGVDNDEMTCNLSEPSLSSIKLNIEKGGYEAAELIERLILDRDAPYTDVVIEPVGIVERLSTNIYATDDPYILIVLQYIHQHLHTKISVTDIVRMVPLSRRLLEIRFKQVTGQPVYKYIFNLRMERFAQLLLGTNDPIAEVALNVGLVDYKNLARQFKIQRGYSPLEYRKQYRVK